MRRGSREIGSPHKIAKLSTVFGKIAAFMTHLNSKYIKVDNKRPIDLFRGNWLL